MMATSHLHCDRSLKLPLVKGAHKKRQLQILTTKNTFSTYYLPSTRPVIHCHSTNIWQHATLTCQWISFTATLKFQGPPAGNKPNGYCLSQATHPKTLPFLWTLKEPNNKPVSSFTPAPSATDTSTYKKSNIRHSSQNFFDSPLTTTDHGVALDLYSWLIWLVNPGHVLSTSQMLAEITSFQVSLLPSNASTSHSFFPLMKWKQKPCSRALEKRQ
jgi:hypothetical protein